MTNLERIQDLYQKMNENKTMEAFETYYADHCKVYEMANGEVRDGKAAQRDAIMKWYEGIEEFHAGGIGAITSNEEQGTTAVESWFDITFKEGGRMKLEEVGVQKWKDGQIVEEKFYYHMPGQG